MLTHIDALPVPPRLVPMSALRALHQVAVATGGVLEPLELADLVVGHARKLLGADAAHLYLWDERAGGLRIVAATDPFHLGGDVPVAPGEGAAGQAFLVRRAVVAGDYAAWEHATEGSLARGVRAAVAAPLLAGERAVGVLSVRFESTRAFRSDPAPVLTLLAAQVAPHLAAALGAAQQQAEERRARERAERAALEHQGSVASTVHDLRSGLAAVKGFAQLAAVQLGTLDVPEAAQVAGHLARIDAASVRMARMLDELLDAAHAGTPQAAE
jgi:signal transduction histidine kinase